MKTLLVLVALVAMSFGALAMLRKPELAVHAKEGDYTIEVPRSLFFRSTEKQTHRTMVGAIESHFEISTGFGSKAIAIMHISMPEVVAQKESPLDTVGHALDDAAKGIKAKLGERKIIQLAGNQGMEAPFEGEFKGKHVYGLIRMFRVSTSVVGAFLMGTEVGSATDENLLAYMNTMDYVPAGR